MSSLRGERLARTRTSTATLKVGQPASVVCVKCDRKLLGRLRKDGKAHTICPRRKHKRGQKKAMRLLRHDADHQRAKAAGYDAESRITESGREILSPKEWKKRRAECFDHDLYVCRGCRRPLAVGYEWFDAHHVIKRSDGGSDALNNLETLCRACHDERHPEKQVKWSKSA